MAIDLTGRRVLVTAAAQGIGRAIAIAFKNAGARVHVCDVDRAALAALAAAEPSITGSAADVGDAAEVAQLFTEAVAALGGLDVLVNNAGIAGPTAGVEDLAPVDWDRVIAVNLSGQFYAVRLAVPLMRQAGGGAIVNISSTSGRTGLPLRVAYATSKHAVIGLSETLARELGPANIRVNAVLPGFMNNARSRRVVAAKSQALGISEDQYRQGLLRFIAMGTMIEEEEIADTVVFLASPAARHITGQAISVCGGISYEE